MLFIPCCFVRQAVEKFCLVCEEKKKDVGNFLDFDVDEVIICASLLMDTLPTAEEQRQKILDVGNFL
jgi:hypothetical protein